MTKILNIAVIAAYAVMLLTSQTWEIVQNAEGYFTGVTVVNGALGGTSVMSVAHLQRIKPMSDPKNQISCGPIYNFRRGWGTPTFGANKAHYWGQTYDVSPIHNVNYASLCGIRVSLHPRFNPMLPVGTFTKCAKCLSVAPTPPTEEPT